MGASRSVAVAGRRVARALVALPRQIVAVVRPDAGSWVSMFDRKPSETRGARGPTAIGLVFALVANVAALVLALTLARAIWYPFWAAGATRAELERSWGGPSAVGATLVHWLVAVAKIAAAYMVILGMERLSDPRR